MGVGALHPWGRFHHEGHMATTVPYGLTVLLVIWRFFLAQKSFHREIPYNWERYNTVMVRCRGDGRAYNLVLGLCRHFDIQWNDQFHYPFFTRGGPYWQEEFVSVFLSFSGLVCWIFLFGKLKMLPSKTRLIL